MMTIFMVFTLWTQQLRHKLSKDIETVKSKRKPQVIKLKKISYEKLVIKKQQRWEEIFLVQF